MDPPYLDGMRGLLLMLLTLGCGGLMLVRAQQLHIESIDYTVMEGLSSNCVYHVERDARGFIWLATSKGLDRFDGQRFRHFPYSHMAMSEDRLAQQFIQLYAASDTLFLLTLSRSLVESAHDIVVAFNPISLEDEPRYAGPRPNHRGGMVRWGDWNGRWDFSSGNRDSTILHLGDRPISPPLAFHPLLYWSLWQGNAKDSSLLVQSIPSQQHFLMQDGDSTRLLETTGAELHGHVLQGTWDGLIHRCDGSSVWYFNRNAEGHHPPGSLMRIHPDGRRTAEGHWDTLFPFSFPVEWSRISLQHNPWNDEVWCFKDNELIILDARYQVLFRKAISPHPAFASLINTVSFVNEREVWVGSCKGITIIHAAPSPFEAFFNAERTLAEDEQGTTPGTNNVRAIVELGPDSIAFATNMHGVRLLVKGRSTMVAPEWGAGAGLLLDNDTLFLCTPDGIGYLNRTGKVDWLYTFEDFPLQSIWTLHRLGTHQWMVGGLGLASVDTRSGEVRRHVQPDGAPLGDVYHFDRWRDTLWMCTSTGVHAWDAESQCGVPWHLASPGAPYIMEAQHRLIDERGDHWFGTATQGLLHYQPETGSLTALGPAEGLPSTTVYGGIQDGRGIRWFSTDQGLMQWFPEPRELRLFDGRHGMHETEFNRTAIHLGRSGHAYFGTINGLVRFNPTFDDLKGQATPPLAITSLLQHRGNADTLTDVLAAFERRGVLSLEPQDEFIAIAVALLDYSGVPRQFRYQVSKDLDSQQEWVLLDGPNLNLSGLAPGPSRVRIQARRRGEPWGGIEKEIPVIVGIPWYEQPLRLTMLAVLALGLTGALIAWRVRRLKARNLLLESMVDQRTQSLNEALTAKDLFLKEIHHRVKNNLQIMGDLLDLQADQQSETIVREALATGRSRLQSIALIHKHLYLDAEARRVQLTEFIHEYASHVQDGLINPHDHVDWHMEGDEIQFDIECAQAFGLLLNELVTNSLQHGRKADSTLRIDIRWHSIGNERVGLNYRDNGHGLPVHLDPEGETSLGLKLIRSLTEQLEGTMNLHPENRAEWAFELTCSFRNTK